MQVICAFYDASRTSPSRVQAARQEISEQGRIFAPRLMHFDFFCAAGDNQRVRKSVKRIARAMLT
jgi:hypothetical protein